jgi:peptide/nickel transport system permease protein
MSAVTTAVGPGVRGKRAHVLRQLAHPAPVIVALLVLLAVVGPYLTPFDPIANNLADRLQPPSSAHWLGTDSFGRDVLSRVIAGARLSLSVSVIGTAAALVLGVLVGSVSAYFGGWVDAVLMRIMDVILAFPYIILAIALAWVIGPSVGSVMIIIAVIRFPQFARISRSSVLEVRRRNFVAAASLVGQRDSFIMARHVLPNGLGTTVVYATLVMGTGINTEAALSFLGVGVPPPAASWGSMLADAKGFISQAPWLLVFPAIAVTVSILAFNMWGDHLRDQLDPRAARALGR